MNRKTHTATPVVLTRNWKSTARWYIGTVPAKIGAAVLAAAVVSAMLIWQWPAVVAETQQLAASVSGLPSPAPVASPVDVRPLFKAQAALSAQLTTSKAEVDRGAALAPENLLGPLRDDLVKCSAVIDAADSVVNMDLCTASLASGTKALSIATQTALDAATAAEAAARDAALRAQPTSAPAPTAAATTAPAPAPEPAPAPAPAPVQVPIDATQTLTVTCSTHAVVTFSSNGHIVVTGVASGSSVGDSGTLSLDAVPGVVHATATALGTVYLNASWTGTCHL